MALTSLVTDHYQTDPDLIYVYEVPGLTWTFVGAKTPRETRKAARLQEDHKDNPDVEFLHCVLSAATIAMEGPLSYYPKSYRAPVLDKDGQEIVDPKTGRPKTKAHPLAGKKIPTTPDVLATSVDERVLVDINKGLGQTWFGRSPADQEEFRGEDSPVDEPLDS